jgi:nickel/cobalt transporter (NiCoT) family protein
MRHCCLHWLQWSNRLYSSLPPQLQLLPYPAIRIISLLILVNLLVWAIVGVVLHSHATLSSTALLSYTLGLRHALDADHISAIDLMTRRLVATGSKPVTVGMWFSLGHSTIVIITCIVVAATSGALEERFDGFRNVGGIIGTGVSAGVLIILGVGNAWILWKLVQRMRVVLREQDGGDQQMAEGAATAGLDLEGGGIMVRLFKKIFKFIDRPWKMYPLGVLFGLGFDTSSEVALLGIASIQGADGTSIWLILIFPLLFTGWPPYSILLGMDH